MYTLIERFQFFPTEFPKDSLFMHLLADHIYERYGGTNAEILIAWLKEGEWPSYQDYDSSGHGRGCACGGGNGNSNFYGYGAGYSDGAGCGLGNCLSKGHYSGTGNGNSYSAASNVNARYYVPAGSGSGRGTDYDFRNIRGNGYTYGKNSGGGDGNGNCSELLQFSKYRINLTKLEILQKIDFTTRFEKGSWVFTRDNEGGCFYGQYQQHNGREVCLANARHLWGWFGGPFSIYNLASSKPNASRIKMGSLNPEPLLLLSCGVIIPVSEQYVADFNEIPTTP